MEHYIPLHVHTCDGSIGDSTLKIKDYVKKAKEYGIKSISITDHGSLASMYVFYHECIKNDIKPIIGCEIYETKDRLNTNKDDESSKKYNHLVLLAKNKIGMENLLKISNDAHINGFYYKPRTDINFLKKYGEGIIALSACLAGKIPSLILKNDPESAISAIKEYKNAFDEFYLEIQPGNFEEQNLVNTALVELAEYTNTPLVVTNDIHYLNQENYLSHDAHIKINRKKLLEDPQIYPDSCYWFMDRESLLSSFNNRIDESILNLAIDNTILIASRCNVSLDNEISMPKFKTGKGETEDSQLAKMCFERLDEIKETLEDPSSYSSRLIYELDVISQLGFSGYFLIVEDFIRYAKNNGIAVGPGRGSIGGALAGFLLSISLADPIKYDLIFERFLSPHRKSCPDIDIDFDSFRREEMFYYAISKYGVNKCSLVSTFMMRKAKASIKDTARILGIDLEIANKISELIPKVYYDDEGEKSTDLSIRESITVVPELQEMEEEYPELFNMAIQLSDIPSSSSIHAAGILISPNDLGKTIPIIRSNKEGIYATSLNLNDSEKSGVVKFDFLSLLSLNVYEKTQKDVGYSFDFLNNEFNDEKVWSLIGSKYLTGLFQISSSTYKSRMHRLKPKTIKELAACLALVRGPCISSGQDKIYMEIVEGKREVDPIHELYYQATKETYGILIYQEDLMQIAVNFGFTLEEGYALVKAVSKKKIEDLEAFENDFINKCNDRDISKEISNKIWKIILDSGLYLFNKAHAVQYAILCYVSAELKTYYPKEFLTNLLTNACERKKKDEITEVIHDCRRLGYNFLPLDVNISKWEFFIENDMIRIGICAIKGFGKKAFNEIYQKRPYASLDELLDKVEKKKCSKRSIIPGIFSGLFDSISNLDRKRTYEEFIGMTKDKVLDVIKLQTKDTINTSDSLDILELTLLGGDFIHDPANQLESFGFNNIKIGNTFIAQGYIKNLRKIQDKNKNDMAFATFSTGDGYIDCVFFNNVFNKYKDKIKVGVMLTVKAKKDKDDSCVIQEII